MPMEKKAALSALAALSQGTRLDIYRLLVQAGPGGRPAGAIAEALGVAPNTLSFHLAQLTQAGLVAQRRESRSLIYSAEYDRMDALMAFLSVNCRGLPSCAGTPE
jgi:DNA-binding transcriptional ArsR family regulator